MVTSRARELEFRCPSIVPLMAYVLRLQRRPRTSGYPVIQLSLLLARGDRDGGPPATDHDQDQR